MGEPSALLDPADPEHRRQLHAWLSVQAHFALRPVEWGALFEREPDPWRALRRAELPPLPEPALTRMLARLAELGARALPPTSPLYPLCLAHTNDHLEPRHGKEPRQQDGPRSSHRASDPHHLPPCRGG